MNFEHSDCIEVALPWHADVSENIQVSHLPDRGLLI